MQQASLTGFLRTILIIFLFVMFLRVVSRMLMPYFLSHILGKSQQNRNRHPNPKPPQRKKKINYNKNNKVGEYIDYEEVE